MDSNPSSRPRAKKQHSPRTGRSLKTPRTQTSERTQKTERTQTMGRTQTSERTQKTTEERTEERREAELRGSTVVDIDKVRRQQDSSGHLEVPGQEDGKSVFSLC